MSHTMSFPLSFPNTEEESFLRLLLTDREHFRELWEAWKTTIVFDEIDFATLRLLPLLYMRLREAGITNDKYVGKIRGVYRMVWARNQRLINEVAAVADTCRERGIDVLLLKGLALLIDMYRDPAARFLGDGDILIKKEDVPRVFEILEELGWTCVDPSVSLKHNARYEGLFEVTHAVAFRNKTGVEIEVHWHVFHVELERDLLRLLLLLSPHNRANTTLSWQRARAIKLKEVPVKMLSYEDMLVHVIVHGAEGNDNHRTLRWVVDAAYVINTTSLDWDRVLEITRDGAHIVAMRYGITYLKDKMHTDIPSAFVSKLMQLTYSSREHRNYLRRTRVWFPPLGNFPSLWYRYWKYESRGSYLERVRHFSPYLKQAWSVSPTESLLTFIYRKYCERMTRKFGRK